MLTDKQKRAVFDEYGEEGLKGVPAAAAAGGGAGGSAPGGGGGGVHFSHVGGGGHQDPRVIFSQFFGTANPFAAFGGGGM